LSVTRVRRAPAGVAGNGRFAARARRSMVRDGAATASAHRWRCARQPRSS